MTGNFFVDHVAHEMHVCDYLLAVDMDMAPVPGYEAASWAQGYGDFAVRPDLATLRRIPWLLATALVMADCVDGDGNDLPHAPRSILKRQIARAEALGYRVMMGSKLAFYVFNESYESAVRKGYRDLDAAGWYIEDHHIFQTTKEEGLIRAIRNGMEGAGIEVEFSKGARGPGQEEINLRYTEALDMADRHAIYKNGAKEIAHGQDKSITFMAKWRDDLAGNCCHIHSSLWDAETNTPSFVDDAQPDGASTVLRQFLAGQIACAREMTYFLAPYINSYKRSRRHPSPRPSVWSRDNRTAGFRIPGPGPATRVECRIRSADVNPYLAFRRDHRRQAARYREQAGARTGFEGDAYSAEGIREVPKTLREALAALDASAVLRAALGDAVVEHYLHTGRWSRPSTTAG